MTFLRYVWQLGTVVDTSLLNADEHKTWKAGISLAVRWNLYTHRLSHPNELIYMFVHVNLPENCSAVSEQNTSRDGRQLASSFSRARLGVLRYSLVSLKSVI